MISQPKSATVLGILAMSVLTASASPVVTVRQGTVHASENAIQTTTPRSAAEVRLPSSNIIRLAGVSHTTTQGPIHLEKGQALLSSSRNLFGRPAIHTTLGPITVSIRGTALLSALPGQPVKVTVLEGSATARLAERRSHFTEISAGSMLMLTRGETTLPKPTEVRLSRLHQTSGLFARPFANLPADHEIQKAISRQENELNKKRLFASNIKVRGGRATISTSSSDSSSDSSQDSGSSSTSSSTSSSSSTNSSASSSGGSSTSSSPSSSTASSGLHCVGCASHATPVGAVSANDPNRIAQIRAEAAAAAAGSSGTSSTSTIPGGIVSFAVPGGIVSSAITIPDSDSRGDLDSAQQRTTISVANSTDLNALAQAFIFASFGEDIAISKSSFNRQPGTINLDAGNIFERTLSLNQGTFTADIIKGRSFNTPGTNALVINGSSFNASQLIRLYAEGGGDLRFNGDVSLLSPRVDLAGSVVQIDPGSIVRTTGNVSVFSDDHRYDRDGYGTLQSKTPKTTLPFAARPRY